MEGEYKQQRIRFCTHVRKFTPYLLFQIGMKFFNVIIVPNYIIFSRVGIIVFA